MTARSDATRPFAITGRMVLIGMIAFFGVILAVNGAFVYFALESWPGLTTRHAYNEGVEYNRVLASAEAQAARGWHAELTHGAADGDTAFRVALTGRDGKPLSGLLVHLAVERPVGGDPVKRIDLAEAQAGIYRASMPHLGSGRWHVGLIAASPGEPDFYLRYEIAVRR